MPSFFHWHLTVVDRVREEEKKKRLGKQDVDLTRRKSQV